jgi:hypothetical protein
VARHLLITLVATLTASTGSAFAWTAPAIVSNTGTNYGLMPRVAPGFSGTIYVTWHQATWGVYFRERSAGGTWSSITTLRNNSNWAADTTVTEDGAYRPHVAYTEQDGAGTRYLVHHYRNDQGTWVRTVLSSGNEESCPCMDTDSLGRVHLVYAKGGNNQHYLYHRIWTNGTWGSDIAIGTGAIESGRVGYDRPDFQVSGTNLHMCWIQPGGDRYVVRYRRFDGNTWLPGITIGQSVNYSWMAGCRIAAADANTIVAAWSRDTAIGGGASRIFHTVSTDGGTTWSAEQQLSSNDTSASNMYGRGGRAYLVTCMTPAMNLYTWYNGSWSAVDRVNPGETTFKSWGDVTQTVDGAMHVVYYSAADGGNNTGGVGYVMRPSSLPTGTVTGRVIDSVGPVPYATITSSLGGQATSDFNGDFTLTCPAGTLTVRVSMPGYHNTDVPNVVVTTGQDTAIGDVALTGLLPMSPNTSLAITPGDRLLTLAWLNSPNVNFSGTLVVYRTDRYPITAMDGTVAVDKPGDAGQSDGYVHSGLTNGVRIYYALFAHDNHPIRTYSSALTGTGIPAMKTDRDSDGDLDQSDFGWFQTCLSGAFIQQTDPNCTDADLDHDADVDQDDFTVFEGCLTGHGVLAVSTCLP